MRDVMRLAPAVGLVAMAEGVGRASQRKDSGEERQCRCNETSQSHEASLLGAGGTYRMADPGRADYEALLDKARK
jgi:hypothetical protein